MSIFHSVRTWALVAVGLTSGAMIYFGWKLISLLAEPTWCNRAIGAADKSDARPEYAVGGCFSLLAKQVDALALNSHFALGTLALSLLVLVVIVLAGGKLSFKASKDGITGDIASDAAAEAANATAAAAVAKADEITEQV